MPIEVLERLGSRSKRIASPEVNLEQLRRESEATRKKWWEEIEANREEYNSLPYDRDKFLESNMALARLKLILSYIDNEEKPPQHSFTREELNLLREFEQFIVYDRLSAEEVKEYVRSGRDEGGIVTLAKRAAVSGYDQIYKIMEQRNIPSDLAFALQRIYQDRIRKMEVAASEIKLTEIYKEVEKVEVKGVGARDIQLMERSYITQLETKLRKPEEEIKWNKWCGIKRFDRLKKIYNELKTIKPVSMAVFKETMPHALGITAANKRRWLLLFRKTVLMLEVKMLSDYRELHLSGHEAEEIAFGELMLHVEEAIKKVKKHPYVLALAATTHWEGKAINYAKEGVGLSPNLCLVLIDLRDKRMHYNPEDERLEKVLPFLEA